MTTPAPTPSPAVLDAVDLVKAFGPRHHRHTAVQRMSLRVQPGMTLGIVGESGSGKSTLARMLVGLESPTSGTVSFDGVDLSDHLATKEGRILLRRNVQFVGQDTTSSFDPRHPLIEGVVDSAVRLLGLTRAEATERAQAIFAELELPENVGERYPNDVSGGQRQRVSLARALVIRPRLLLCDEAVSALDVSVQGTVLNLLRDYCEEEGAGLVFVSHGLAATAFVAEELLVLYRGEVVERGSTDALIANPQHPYTRQLLLTSTTGVEHAEIEKELS